MVRIAAALLALQACRAAPDEAGPARAAAPTRGESSGPPAAPSTPPSAGRAATSSDVAPRLAPLANVDWIEKLPLGDGNLAYVTPPLGAAEPRPLIVAVHGAGDRAEWSCGGWRLAASGYAFVVCPQGLKMDAQRFAWDGPATLARRVEAALDAARARFGPYIADGPTLYAGFSQGATLASAALLEKPQRFPVVALAEGAYELVNDDAFLRRLQQNGTMRVVLVCGNPACFQHAKRASPHLARRSIEAIVAGDPLSGHNLNQRMQDALHQAWPSVVAGLPNWRGFAEFVAGKAKR